MANKRVDIILGARDEATRVLNNIASGTLPGLVKSLGGMVAGAVSAGAAIGFLTSSFREFAEAEKITKKLEGALRDAGLEVKSNSSYLDAMATKLSRVTMADDEAIKSAQTLLISLGGLAGDGLDKATEAALDLSAALGKDLNESATMIAKAANGSTIAFGKLGFKFREGASDGEKFNEVLAQIQKKFGTAAESEVDTLAGATANLAKEWNNLKEAIGGAANAGGVTAALKIATLALSNFVDTAKEKGFWRGLANTVAAIGAPGSGQYGMGLAGQRLQADADAEAARLKALNRTKDEDAEIRAEEAAALRQKTESEAFWQEEGQRAEKAAEELARVVERLVTGINYGAPIDLIQGKRKQTLTGLSPDVFTSIGFDQPAPFPITAGGAMARAGAPNMADIATEGLDAATAWEAANAQFGASKEKMAAVAEALAPALERMQALGMATPETTAALKEMDLTMAAVSETMLAFELGQTVMEAFASGFVQSVEAIVEGTATMEQAFRTLIKGVLKALAQELLAKAAKEIAEGFAALAWWGVGAGMAAQHFKAAAMYTAGAALAAGGAGSFAGGGIVGRHGAMQRFAGGGMVRPAAGFDSVPAMLTPGEMVLTKRATDSVLGGRAVLAAPGGAGGGGPVNLHMTFTSLDPRANRDMVEDLLVSNPGALRAALDNMQRKGV